MLSFQLKTGKNEAWFYGTNTFHRRGDKAEKLYHVNGTRASCALAIDGVLHNTKGPAYMRWYQSGKLICEEHFTNDMRHNPKGPALRIWNASGKLMLEKFFLSDEKLTKSEWEKRRCSVSN